MTIPSALDFLFPEGYVPWYALPDPGVAPTTITVMETINMASDFIIDAGEVLFASDGATTIASSWDMPYVTNNGVMWVQHSNASVTGISSGNINVFVNNGTLNAFSANNNATGAYFGSWGVMQNSGTVRAISYSGDATAYITWSSDAWDRDNESNNTGTIEAWSGLGNATAVHLVNAGNYLNTGTILATGKNNATAFETSGHNSIITNSGLIEAITDGTNASIAIHNSWATEMTIVNSGTIRGDYAVYADLAYNDPIRINNEIAGVIEGDIFLNNTPSVIINNGQIVGNISTGSGTDSFDSINGTFTGVLDLGQGDDIADMGSTDDIVIGGRGNDTLRGHDGDDTLDGGANNDLLFGGAGDDILIGQTGDDFLDGGEGTNYAVYNGTQANYTITDGGNGTWTITGEGTDTLINIQYARFTDGDVELPNNEPVFTEGDDVINGTEGDDVYNTLGGDDIVNGFGGNDTFNGGTGNDTLDGGAGNDTLRGDEGADRFVFEAGGGNDVIIDWVDGDDFLDLTSFGVSDAMDYAAQAGSDVVFTFGTDVITIENVTILEISDSVLI